MRTRRPEQSFVRAGAAARTSGGLRVSSLALGVAATLILRLSSDWISPGDARADAATPPTSSATTPTSSTATPANTTTAAKPTTTTNAHPTTSAKSPAVAQASPTVASAQKPAAAPAKAAAPTAANTSAIPAANPATVHPARPTPATTKTAVVAKPSPAPTTTAMTKPPVSSTTAMTKPPVSATNPANASARVASTHPGVTVSSTPMVAGTTPQSKLNVPGTHLEDRIAYQYNALGRRDPFQPLVDGGFVGNDVGGDAPPDVGGIKVVGIVWGTNDKFALVEDPSGNSLVLRPGDKVMNGVVTSLKRDAVMVTMTVDGQTESVAIPLTRKGENSNGNR
jgi:hypothetical protein